MLKEIQHLLFFESCGRVLLNWQTENPGMAMCGKYKQHVIIPNPPEINMRVFPPL